MNLGAGNISLQNRRYAILGEAEAQRVRVINQVRQEITSARAEALAARDQIEIARSELASAENGLREDTERSRNNLGRPIEVLNSLSLVGGARVNVIAALLRYDQAQFRLFVALGSPPPLLEPPQENLPPPPVTTPLQGSDSCRRAPVQAGLRVGREARLSPHRFSSCGRGSCRWMIPSDRSARLRRRPGTASRTGHAWDRSGWGRSDTGLPNSECCQSR